ncbi:hypothetical protein EUC41_09140 [Achromobacter denitrificans]|uniref:hypothetical protein n=1 Tax=Achromobacter denitrificans TaxID=32002 RepID=UPI00240D1E34|nr:hypothetical protein [Achromobacter denitrificans]WFC66464.1 hypothetical protein EUC41_09140 [Achromobacter denitrificans]
MLNIPAGYKLVPIEPTETMVVCGFESRPDPVFSKPEDWEAFAALTGCQQAAHKARLCYAAMLDAAPTPPSVAPGDAQDEPIGTLSRNADETIRFTPARDFHVKDGMPVFSTPAAGDAQELLGALIEARRELQSCQAVIHLAGGFDPTYVRDAQAAIRRADAAIAAQQGKGGGA